MRTPEEIVAKIDAIIAGALCNPDGYASSPRSLEELLIHMDRLRKFILDSNEGFYDLYQRKGYGARSFIGHEEIEGRGNDPNILERLVDLWREYLAVQGRL